MTAQASGNPRRAAAMVAGTLACTLAIQMMATAGTLAFAVLAPAIPGVPLASVGVFLALVYVGGMVGSICGGALVDRLGPVRASQLSLLIQVAALCMLASGHPWLRLPAALALGLGYGPVTPASSQILARTTSPERMSLVFSLKQTGVPLGGLLGGMALPPLTALWSWQAALYTLAAGSAIVALVAQALRAQFDFAGAAPSGSAVPPLSREEGYGNAVPPLARARERARGRGQPVHDIAARISRHLSGPIADALSSPRLRALVAVSVLFSACQLSVSGYLMVFLTDEVGISLTAAGMVYAVTQGAGVVGRIAWGHLADRTGSPRGVLVALGVLMAATLLAAGFFTAQWPALALTLAAAALGATAIGWNGVYLGEVARLAPPGRVATTTGGALFFTYLGVVAGPPAFGYLAQGTGSLALAYGALAALPALGIALLCLAGRHRLASGDNVVPKERR
ncbi:MFS transporter [Paracidovorax citrulli]